jgi:hypothetical protein
MRHAPGYDKGMPSASSMPRAGPFVGRTRHIDV